MHPSQVRAEVGLPLPQRCLPPGPFNSPYTPSVDDGPVPPEWVEKQIPPEAVATYYEGFCPVHPVVPLKAWTLRVFTAPQSPFPPEDIPAGWCHSCRAYWSRPYGPSKTDTGLCATWSPE